MRGLVIYGTCLLLGACTTSLETRPDQHETKSNLAIGYESYSLPMVRYDITVDAQLTGCTELVPLTFLGTPIGSAISYGLAISVKVTPTPEYVAGESYNVDHEALSSFFKTSSLSIETWPSGTLKSIGAGAKDHTGAVIKDVVKTGVGIALLSTGSPLGLPITTSTVGVVPLANNYAELSDASSLVKLRRKFIREDLPASAFSPKLSNLPVTLCRDGIAPLVVATKQLPKDIEKLAKALTNATKRVERATLVTNAKAADHRDVEELKEALAAQGKAEDALQLAQEDQAGKLKKLGITIKHQWPSSFDGHVNAGQLPASAADVAKMVELLTREDKEVITGEALKTWFDALPPSAQEEFSRENKAVIKSVTTGKENCNGKLFECVQDNLAITVKLEPSKFGGLRSMLSLNDDGETVTQDKTVVDARVVNARDDKADQGVFYRPPVPGDLIICGQGTEAALGRCGGIAGATKTLQVVHNKSVPQLGQLRFFPFKSPPFTASEFLVELREDGSPAKLQYKDTEAAATAVSGTIADAVDQAVKARKSVRDEKIAALQHEIDLATKQKALLEAQTPKQPDEDAAIKAETAHLNAQIAKMQAELSKVKLERELEAVDAK